MSLGVTELIVIFVILLLFFGPSRLPGLGKSLGETIRGFKKAMEQPEIDVTEKSKKASQLKEKTDLDDPSDPGRNPSQQKKHDV